MAGYYLYQALAGTPAPYDGYDAAHDAAAVRLGSPQHQPGTEYRVLLDVSSVDLSDQAAVDHLLMVDPLLHAVFNLGYQLGRTALRAEGDGP